MPWARMLADLIVVFHASYVSFVVLGLVAILVGAALHWRWVRNFWFRIAHLAAIGVVVLESLAGIPCPLTVWESQLRRRRADRLHRRLHRPLGPSVDLLSGRALGFHDVVRAVRSGRSGSLHPGAAALVESRWPRQAHGVGTASIRRNKYLYVSCFGDNLLQQWD